MMFALILFAHVGPLADGNSNALATVQGFANIDACMQAGKAAESMAKMTTKVIKFACVSMGGVPAQGVPK